MGWPEKRKNVLEKSGGGKCEKLDSFFCPKTVKVEDEAKEVVSSPEIKINNIELYFINCILT